MANNHLTSRGFLLRLSFALALVLLSYNPSPYSYYNWIVASFEQFNILVVPAGVLLLIGWTMYIRATLRSLGPWGLILAFGLFGSLLWVVIDWGIVEISNIAAISWIIEIIMALVLGVGMCWSHVRRKISGQVDVEDGEE
ncbi:MAG: hypothetical protein KUG78_19540 [Kangiellaceae bacterium]|nr:hypothetical protein [Kangiellaceae bacterium]